LVNATVAATELEAAALRLATAAASAALSS